MTYLDTQYLGELSELNPDDPSQLLRELVRDFRIKYPQTLAQLAAAIEQRDMSQIEALAHSLKSSAAAMGASVARECCQVVESCAAAGDVDGAGTGFPRIREEMDRASQELERYLLSTFGQRASD